MIDFIHILIAVYLYPRVFFVIFLIFELWSILYFTVVNGVLDLAKDLVGFIAKYAVDSNLFWLIFF